MRGSALEVLRDALEAYDTSNTVVRFAPNEPLPASLVIKIRRSTPHRDRGEDSPRRLATYSYSYSYSYARQAPALAPLKEIDAGRGDFLLEQLYSFVGEGWEQEDDITLLTLRRSVSSS